MFSSLWYYFGYHIIFIALASLGIIRFRKHAPWLMYAIGLVIQILADFKYTGEGSVFGCLFYFAAIAVIFAWITRFRVESMA